MPLTFEPIRLERQEQYRDKLSQCGQIASDYSFINLWGWGEEYGLEWAWQEEWVWIRQTKPQPALWAPVGDWRQVDWATALKAAGAVADRIVRVPETLVNVLAAFSDPARPPAESRNHWDYLYSLQELVELKGNRFHKKKNLLNQFLNTYTF
ncbi:MAG: phosphatidylglycerol lysyltransferase domain-containing protein, partial [Desulfatitalea sp.]